MDSQRLHITASAMHIRKAIGENPELFGAPIDTDDMDAMLAATYILALVECGYIPSVKKEREAKSIEEDL